MAFHPYPQLIPAVFNLRGFAPPRRLTIASHWPWVDHPASGPGHATNNTPLGFGFPTATPHGLTSRHAADSQAHSSKGTPSATKGPLTDCKHMVSGTISLPSRGTFHHSLTVLSTIGQYKYLGLPGGPGRFTADSTSPLLLGQPNNQYALAFNYRTLTFSGRPFQAFSSNQHINQQRSGSYVTSSAHNTAHTTPTKYHMHTV